MGIAKTSTLIDFLREAPPRNLLVHRTLAPTEGSRWQNREAGLEARISAHGAADEILQSRAKRLRGFEFRVSAPSGSHRLRVNPGRFGNTPCAS